MLKMGVRKASMLRRSVNNLLPYVTGEGEKVCLTPREENMLEMFHWFMEESFSDGEGCLSLEQMSAFPSARGYNKQDLCVAYNYESLKNNLDNVEYIAIGDTKFYKTSRMCFYMEKYCGDLDMNQINNLSIRDMLRRISDGEDELERRQEEELCH